MNLIDWLRKLGILRFGAESAIYHNAKERPLSLQKTDVFDSKKDVIDFDQATTTPSQAKQQSARDNT